LDDFRFSRRQRRSDGSLEIKLNRIITEGKGHAVAAFFRRNGEASTGEFTIKKLILSLVAVCALALGAVWMVLSPSPPAERKAEKPETRALAYEQAIAQRETGASDKKDEAAKTAEIPPFETVTSESEAIVPVAPADGEPSQDVASLPDESPGVQGQSDWPGAGQDRAAIQGRPPALYDGVPPHDGVPPLPGEGTTRSDQWGTDGAEQWGDQRRESRAYGPPGGADPYGAAGQADPYGPPQAGQWGDQGSTQWADENTEQWVEVIVSGAPMRATASEDAPMLFAFPYGRNLKVISRYKGWVEVTDPQSAATGWMQAHLVAPSGANRQPYGQNEAYYEDDSRRRGPGDWFRRSADELSNMLNRAFGGN
jgi:hypothetical protein